MALSLVDAQKIRAAFVTTIETLGVPATWTQTKPPNTTVKFTAGFKTVGRGDTELANAYGIGAKVITMTATATPTPPQKFDRIDIGGESFALDHTFPIHLNGQVIGYKGVARGK